jgi:hypothetical protein
MAATTIKVTYIPDAGTGLKEIRKIGPEHCDTLNWDEVHKTIAAQLQRLCPSPVEKFLVQFQDEKGNANTTVKDSSDWIKFIFSGNTKNSRLTVIAEGVVCFWLGGSWFFFSTS